MKKILLSISLLLSAAIYNQVKAQNFNASPFPDRIILTWSGDPKTTQSVTWRTDSTVRIGYGQILLESSSPKLEKPDAKEYQAVTSTLKGKEY
ncbi:MAG: metallophosphoesterase, partial [Pedobacter sp.]